MPGVGSVAGRVARIEPAVLVSGEEPKMSSREFSAAGMAVVSADMVVAGEGGAEFAELESVWVGVIAV